jgi:hypothetical protein
VSRSWVGLIRMGGWGQKPMRNTKTNRADRPPKRCAQRFPASFLISGSCLSDRRRSAVISRSGLAWSQRFRSGANSRGRNPTIGPTSRFSWGVSCFMFYMCITVVARIPQQKVYFGLASCLTRAYRTPVNSRYTCVVGTLNKLK